MKKDAPFYKKLIDKFPEAKVLVIGDLMVDRFIRGKVTRISPEAPVPVVKVREENLTPGGAGNVMMNLAALGAKITACGVIGEDTEGENLLEYFANNGIDTGEIQRDSERRTIIKTRVIADHQQVVRFDHENDDPISMPVQNAISERLPELIKNSDAVILSDYGKGMITRSLLSRTLTSSKRYSKPVCVDPKLEHFLNYKHVTCITPNLNEALGGMRRVKLDAGVDGLKKLGTDILKALQSESVLITQGAEGMTLFEKAGGRQMHIPAKAREVFDVTGAGDTVISVLALCLASGATLVQGSVLANLAASIVVGKLGTATVSPRELKESLKFL